MKLECAYLLSFSLLLSACGGSSTPAPASPPPPPPVGGSAPLVVTTANAKPAVRVAFGSTMQSIETGELAGGGGIASAPSGNLQKPQVERSMSGLVARAVQKIPLGPLTENCLQFGTTTISGELATGIPFSVGDTIFVEATDCDDGLGEVVNGRMEITITAYSGDLVFGPTYFLEMTVLLIDFEVATATDTILSNGDSTVTVDTSGTPLIVLSISGASMTTQSMIGTDIVTDFMTTQTVDSSVIPEPYTLSASATIVSSQIAGQIVHTTPVTFQGAGAGYPFAGELLITGANNATIRLIALSDVNVRIETDADGDGNVDPDGTEDTTWEDIAL